MFSCMITEHYTSGSYMKYGDPSAEGEVRGRVLGKAGNGGCRVESKLREFGGLWHTSEVGSCRLRGKRF